MKEQAHQSKKREKREVLMKGKAIWINDEIKHDLSLRKNREKGKQEFVPESCPKQLSEPNIQSPSFEGIIGLKVFKPQSSKSNSFSSF